MRLCELKQKEIINTCTCRCLGCPIDVEFDCKTGQILSLIHISLHEADSGRRKVHFSGFRLDGADNRLSLIHILIKVIHTLLEE